MTKPDFAKLDNVFQRHGVTPVDPKELSNKEAQQTDKSTNQQTDKLVKWTTYIRPLARLSIKFRITNTCNQVKSQSKAFSAIPISI